jgi:hypothetical protein
MPNAHCPLPDAAMNNEPRINNMNFQKLSRSRSVTMPQLFIAQAAENRHRINCFAEGIGVLFGMEIAAIGIHGICTLPIKN